MGGVLAFLIVVLIIVALCVCFRSVTVQYRQYSTTLLFTWGESFGTSEHRTPRLPLICSHSHACTHLHTHAHTHTRAHKRTHTCTHTYTHAWARTHAHARTHTHTESLRAVSKITTSVTPCHTYKNKLCVASRSRLIHF